MRIAIIILLIFLISACQNNTFQKIENKVQSEQKQFTISKYDEANKRLFVVVNDLKNANDSLLLQTIQNIIKSVGGYDYDNLSLFNDERFADYKTVIDPELMATGLFRDSYLAEYDRANNTVLLFPLIAEKVKEYSLK